MTREHFVLCLSCYSFALLQQLKHVRSLIVLMKNKAADVCSLNVLHVSISQNRWSKLQEDDRFYRQWLFRDASQNSKRVTLQPAGVFSKQAKRLALTIISKWIISDWSDGWISLQSLITSHHAGIEDGSLSTTKYNPHFFWTFTKHDN